MGLPVKEWHLLSHSHEAGCIWVLVRVVESLMCLPTIAVKLSMAMNG
jgi:hypothetical protein